MHSKTPNLNEGRYLPPRFTGQYIIMLQENSKFLILSSLCCSSNCISRAMKVFSSTIFVPEVLFCHLKPQKGITHYRKQLMNQSHLSLRKAFIIAEVQDKGDVFLIAKTREFY